MARAYALLGGWAKEHRIAGPLMVHHTTKAATNNNTRGGGAIRGASAIHAGIRAGVQLRGIDEAAAKKLPPGEADWWVREEFVKGNHLPPSMGERWYRKQSVQLPTVSPEGSLGPSESVGVLVYKPEGPFAGRGFDPKSDNAKIAMLTAIIAAETEGDPLRIKSYSEAVGAADALAEDLDTTPGNVAAGLDMLLNDGVIKRGQIKQKTSRNKLNVWLSTEKGRAWLVAQTSGPGGFRLADPKTDGDIPGEAFSSADTAEAVVNGAPDEPPEMFDGIEISFGAPSE
jgi:hypothetical protein